METEFTIKTSDFEILTSQKEGFIHPATNNSNQTSSPSTMLYSETRKHSHQPVNPQHQV